MEPPAAREVLRSVPVDVVTDRRQNGGNVTSPGRCIQVAEDFHR
jgi:hypothetical protein